MFYRYAQTTQRRTAMLVLALGLVAAWGTAGWASPEGQFVADHVSVGSYYHLMDDLMYTHDGDDRGWGPEHDLARGNIHDYFDSLGLDVSYHQFYYSSDPYYNVVAENIRLWNTGNEPVELEDFGISITVVASGGSRVRYTYLDEE